MPRPPRRRRPGCSAHVTVRCNNRAFDLQRKEPRLFVLHALARAAEKFGARIYAVAVMSNHVHYLIEPRRPDELPRVMHWLNWYTAMGLNRLLGRRGHFWEARYHASWVSNRDQRHVLNVLRYIHGNPFAAGIAPGFRHEFTNDGSYASGIADGITTHHDRLASAVPSTGPKHGGVCGSLSTFLSPVSAGRQTGIEIDRMGRSIAAGWTHGGDDAEGLVRTPREPREGDRSLRRPGESSRREGVRPP